MLRAFTFRISYFSRPLCCVFIGLFSFSLFFVKVPFQPTKNHFRRTSFNRFSFSKPQTRANLNRWSVIRNHLDCSLLFYFPFLSLNGRALRIPPAFRQIHSSFVPSPYPSCFFKLAVRLPKIRQLSICHVHGTVMDFPLDLGKESSLFVPSLPFISSPCPDGTLPQPLRRSLIVHWRFSIVIFERLKHFLCFPFSLYFYYSTNFSFVKRFWKKN